MNSKLNNIHIQIQTVPQFFFKESINIRYPISKSILNIFKNLTSTLFT